MKKTRQFKKLLTSPQLEFLCEAHNGLSARIVEEAGFKGVWGSGLSISAQLGVRDSNEASWTQVLDVIEFMADATTIPILLDGDTGYGNFNNMRRLVIKLEQRGVAAVCIEDKLFPKTNSFIRGTTQPLADMEEFAGKIKAGKDAQTDDDFCIIARVEAFIAGWGLAEALRRAEAYRQAGADGILIHSAFSVPDEVLAFKKEWGARLPVVIVPTKYYSTPTDVFRKYGFSVAIWANHVLRAAISGMQRAARAIHEAESLMAVEDSIASVAEVFRLQGEKELEDAEKRYLPQRGAEIQAIVLAAARGKELGELTAHKPKAMVELGGSPLLSHIVDGYNAVGIKDVTVVRGYCKEAVDLPSLRYVDNAEFDDTGEVFSLSKALDALNCEKDTIISYGDVLFKKYIIEMLSECEEPFTIAVDTAWQESVNRRRHADYVECTLPYSRDVFGVKVYLRRMSHDRAEGHVNGEWMGFLKAAKGSCAILRQAVADTLAAQDGRGAKIPDLLNRLVAGGHQVRVLYTTGNWLDIDSLEDVVLAAMFEEARMISAQVFVEAARQRGFGLWTGVPCSYLKPFINYVIDSPDLRYVAAANEGDAVAIATGADLGGVRAIAMFQNSGLGNAVNPLTSLNAIFKIPILVITTLRGEPGGPHDEPQHALMGPITTGMLDVMKIPWEYFPQEASEVEPALARAVTHMETTGLPYALVMKKGSVADWKLTSMPEPRPLAPAPAPSAAALPRFTREAVLRAVQDSLRPADVVIASTGFTGRELYALEDRREQLYMVGSMGCAMSLGLGLALTQPKRRVIVLDGDGAVLMRMGGLATVGYERPPNLMHVLLDNQMHESTGGQSTVSHSVDFCAIAAACGYPSVARATTPDEVSAFMGSGGSGLSLLHVRILPGSRSDLPRPTITPPEVAARLRAHIKAG